MALVYRHIRKDKNEPFYIGISRNKKRPYDFKSRNKIWQHIFNKCECEVEILFDDIDYEFAKEKEIEFIALYGRINKQNGCLANMTDGGDGGTGFVYTQKMREAASKRESGKTLSYEHRRKISKAHLGKKKTKEHIEKIAAKNRGKKRKSPSKKARLASSRTQGRKVINIQTGEIFLTLREAAETIGMDVKNLQKKFNGGHKVNNTPFRLYLEERKRKKNE